MSQAAPQAPTPRGRALAAAAPGLLFALLLVVVYADPLFVRRNFAGRDLLGYHLPVESALHDAYARGRLPVWLAEVSGGRPLAANPNTGAFYPIRPLLALFPFPLAMRIYPVLHWALAGLGMLALLRSLAASRGAAWVGAVAYAFSGVSVSEVFYTNIQPGMALLPWLLWSVSRPTRPAFRTLWLALFLGLDLLAGDVFTTGLAIAGALLWILVEEERRGRLRRFGELAAALGLAALAAAPQWVAALAWAPETNRAVAGLTIGSAVQMSLSPWRLLELVVPYPFGETWQIDQAAAWARTAFAGKAIGLFSSLYAGAFAVIAFVAAWRAPSRGARFARLFLALTLALSVLPSFVPQTWRDWPSPFPLRHPEKFVVGAGFALALCAGIGVDRLRARRLRFRWPLLVGGALALSAAAAWAFPAGAGRLATMLVGAGAGSAGTAAERLPGALAEGGLLWIATVLAVEALARPGRAWLAAGFATLTLVPIVANRRIARTFLQEEVFAPTSFSRFVARRDPDGRFRTLGSSVMPLASSPASGSDIASLDSARETWLFFTPVLWKRGEVFNLDVDLGDLSRAESLRRFALAAWRTPGAGAFFGAFSLRFGVRYVNEPPRPGFKRVGGSGVQEWEENGEALADIRIAPKWVEAPSAPRAFALMTGLSPQEIVVETGQERAGSSQRGTVRVLEKSSEIMKVETECGTASWLFVLRGYWPYRRVLVDGEKVEPVPALLAFSAVPLPAGRHRVEWEELLPGFEVSRWGPVLFALTAALIWVRGRRS